MGSGQSQCLLPLNGRSSFFGLFLNSAAFNVIVFDPDCTDCSLRVVLDATSPHDYGEGHSEVEGGASDHLFPVPIKRSLYPIMPPNRKRGSLHMCPIIPGG